MLAARDAIGQRTCRQGNLSKSMDIGDWIDSYPTDTLSQMRQVLDASAASTRWHALLDTSFVPSLRDRLSTPSSGCSIVTLYEGVYDGEGLMAISPCLMSLPDGAETRAAVCADLLRHTAGHPMLSLLRTTIDTDALASHLRRQMEANADDGEAFLVRLADTRCLPTWVKVLTLPQRRRFLAGIDAWWIFDRAGSLMALDVETVGMAGGDSVDTDPAPYRLDTDQVAALRQAAKIDTLLFHVRQRPDTFGQLQATPSQAYACVRDAWEKKDLAAQTPRVALDALKAAGWLVPATISA
ncbi:DUF4123 domain-containing protein [Burkholderia sp. D-99]|nr:DUF4123 domain-containing protein [Burkholderia sp. D-99]